MPKVGKSMFGIFKKRKKQFKPLLVFKVKADLKPEDYKNLMDLCMLYKQRFIDEYNVVTLNCHQKQPIEYDFHY